MHPIHATPHFPLVSPFCLGIRWRTQKGNLDMCFNTNRLKQQEDT